MAIFPCTNTYDDFQSTYNLSHTLIWTVRNKRPKLKGRKHYTKKRDKLCKETGLKLRNIYNITHNQFVKRKYNFKLLIFS